MIASVRTYLQAYMLCVGASTSIHFVFFRDPFDILREYYSVQNVTKWCNCFTGIKSISSFQPFCLYNYYAGLFVVRSPSR